MHQRRQHISFCVLHNRAAAHCRVYTQLCCLLMNAYRGFKWRSKRCAWQNNRRSIGVIVCRRCNSYSLDRVKFRARMATGMNGRVDGLGICLMNRHSWFWRAPSNALPMCLREPTVNLAVPADKRSCLTSSNRPYTDRSSRKHSI